MILQDIFINRKAELKSIPRGLMLGQSFVLVAPRRYGKTTLIKKILNNFNNEVKTIYIDIMRYAYSLDALTEAIVDNCLAQIGFSGRFKSWINNLNLKLDIKIKLQEFEIETIIDKIRKKDSYSAFAQALELQEKLAIKTKTRWVIVYDEIGELQNLDQQTIKIMRSVIQHHKHVSYIFAGSQESVMNKIFISSTGAFYRFGTIYALTELEINDVVHFFRDNLENVQQEVIDYIVDKFRGHPYYTTNIFFRITLLSIEKPKLQIDLKILEHILQELLDSENHYLDDQIKKLSKSKHYLLVLKAAGCGNPYQTDGLSKQSVYTNLRQLIKDGYIRKVDKQFMITDPLLRLYLNEEI